MQEPLLFIQTPPFYYIEVEEVKEDTFDEVLVGEEVVEEVVEEVTEDELEESTSVYELSRTERIKDPVIARQLNYFLQPINQHRLLAFHLLNGDEVIGKISEFIGLEVKVISDEEEVFIKANDILAITTKKDI